MPNAQLGMKSFNGLFVSPFFLQKNEKKSFFRISSQKQGQLMGLLPQQTWSCCIGGQAAPEARHRAVNCKASGAAPQEAEPSSAICAVRMDKEPGPQQPLQWES